MRIVVNSKSSRRVQRALEHQRDLEGLILDAAVQGRITHDQTEVLRALARVVSDPRHKRLPLYRQYGIEGYYRGQVDLLGRMAGVPQNVRIGQSLPLLTGHPPALPESAPERKRVSIRAVAVEIPDAPAPVIEVKRPSARPQQLAVEPPRKSAPPRISYARERPSLRPIVEGPVQQATSEPDLTFGLLTFDDEEEVTSVIERPHDA